MRMEKEEYAELREELSPYATEFKVQRDRRVFVRTTPENLVSVAKLLKEKFDAYYLCTISAVDLMDSIELLYHIWSFKLRCLVSVRVKLPRDDPEIVSLCGILPSAEILEREVKDLMGVHFRGNPKIHKRLVLPEDWPEGVYPLRKDWKGFEK